MLERIKAMLQLCVEATRTTSHDLPFPATVLYNEGWMLRLVLQWFSDNSEKLPGHPLAFQKGARWFSERLLASPFAREEGETDVPDEKHTHPDGVIGQCTIADKTKSGLVLDHTAKQFVVLEAKIFSDLSPDVSKAKGYDQAARTVACMAKALELAEHKDPANLRLAYHVLVPRKHPRLQRIRDLAEKGSIARKVASRMEGWRGTRRVETWYKDWFLPMLNSEKLVVQHLFWEDVIAKISDVDSAFADSLNEFYGKCCDFNS